MEVPSGGKLGYFSDENRVPIGAMSEFETQSSLPRHHCDTATSYYIMNRAGGKLDVEGVAHG